MIRNELFCYFYNYFCNKSLSYRNCARKIYNLYKKKKQDEKLFGKVPPSKFRTPITNAVPWFTSWSPSKNLDVSQLKSMLN